MVAIIVKDDLFKTIGFEVTENNSTLFAWGISPVLKSNFQKQLNLNSNTITLIFDLVRMSARISEREYFVSNVFDTDKNITSLNTKKYDSDTQAMVKKMEMIIKNL